MTERDDDAEKGDEAIIKEAKRRFAMCEDWESHARNLYVDDFKFLKSVAKAQPKVTMPSPSTMHFRGGREAIDEKAYPDMAEFYDDLARVYIYREGRFVGGALEPDIHYDGSKLMRIASGTVWTAIRFSHS